MIRLFVLVGIIGGLAIAYLATYQVGPISQLPPSESLLTNFRTEGYVPAALNLAEDEAAEEAGVFEVPDRDAAELAIALAAAPAMNMGDTGTGGSDSTGMPMAEGGLLITDDGSFDREISLEMSEWSFSESLIDLKMGERIRFTVKNSGQIPHEFMFMSPPLMAAVTYRATRADWSLFEHEALFEKALVLPGGEFSFVMQVQQNGAWMFMCMLPYHMQMGMMGQMATEGMAMDMSL